MKPLEPEGEGQGEGHGWGSQKPVLREEDISQVLPEVVKDCFITLAHHPRAAGDFGRTSCRLGWESG